MGGEVNISKKDTNTKDGESFDRGMARVLREHREGAPSQTGEGDRESS